MAQIQGGVQLPTDFHQPLVAGHQLQIVSIIDFTAENRHRLTRHNSSLQRFCDLWKYCRHVAVNYHRRARIHVGFVKVHQDQCPIVPVRTNRKIRDSGTSNEEPAINITSQRSAAPLAAVHSRSGNTSPNNITFGLSAPPQAGQRGFAPVASSASEKTPIEAVLCMLSSMSTLHLKNFCQYRDFWFPGQVAMFWVVQDFRLTPVGTFSQ